MEMDLGRPVSPEKLIKAFFKKQSIINVGWKKGEQQDAGEGFHLLMTMLDEDSKTAGTFVNFLFKNRIVKVIIRR